MVGVGEGEIGREVATPPEAGSGDEFIEPIEHAEKPGSGLRFPGQRLLVPREVLLRRPPQNRRNEAVLAPEVLVEGPAGDVGLLEERVDSDRGAAVIEELLCGHEKTFARSRGELGRHGSAYLREPVDRPFYTVATDASAT